MKIEFAGYLLDVDVERTKATYAQIKQSGWESCDCQYCKNFGTALPDTFPQEIQNFFLKAGMDIYKDAEVYAFSEVSNGVLIYGGDYYLWGEILKEPTEEIILPSEFHIVFIPPSPLIQKEFEAEGALCFNFTGNIPWVLPTELK